MPIQNPTPFDLSYQISRRRCAANEFLGRTLDRASDAETLARVLAMTPAESADDRDDDLCAVHVRGVLSDEDVDRLITGRSEAYRREVAAVYGAPYRAPRVWKHSWTRRAVRVNGERVVRSRAEWIAENAVCIVRAGGAEVKVFGEPWVRIAPAFPYAAMLAEHLDTLTTD